MSRGTAGSEVVPAYGLLGRLLPAGPVSRPMSLVERNMRAYRRAWLLLLSGFVEPVMYLFGLGIGLGSLVGDVTTDSGRTVSYALFVAPALMAASAMNGAVYDSTFNVFFKLRYSRLYDSVLATPLGPRDVATGEIAWALIRGSLYAGAFFLVMALAGLVRTPWALLALPSALLIGWAFASIGMAVTTWMRSWQDLDLVQLAIVPLFLFSATFYPVSTYPEQVAWLVQVSPLYHGVALVRGVMLAEVGPHLLVHVGVLVALGLLGVAVTERRLRTLLLR
ncbi:ABC transporter permease [Aquipuribacter sp. MA13-6]|uniref:ABC transporter permease n=1 Tax=unclassified Aquipuribacter TaxID=2635084 RepID=UPI003EEFED44